MELATRQPIVDSKGKCLRHFSEFLNNTLQLPSFPTVGTHADRLATSPSEVPDGTLFYETDRTVTYTVRSSAWAYAFGSMRDTISPDNKPGDLGSGDSGFLFFATDFDRTFRWGGAAWADAPGEPPRFQIGFFVAAPGTGWSICNGASVTRSTSTGGTTSITKPNYSTSAYVKAGTTLTAGPTAASGVTGVPSATTVVDNDGAVSTVAVGSDVHTHTPGTLELRRTQLIAYLRL